ncbi:MAG: histidine kinase dimerization/phospho-acceptor domain-containing protein, partial [Gammaproteobacteria bacterium]|nr:histidine kinase dimerization/phospho-acceptor domain-containing protein [Gammaproteobacteria bacterium]
MDSAPKQFEKKARLLSTCAAFDYIDSAIAVVNSNCDIIYQNTGFNKLATPLSPQLAITYKNRHLILSDEKVATAIGNAIEQQDVDKVQFNLPFNSKIALPITLKISPMFCQDENEYFALLSVVEESLSFDIKSRLQKNEKQKVLSEQVIKLSRDNIESRNLISTLLTKSPFGMMIIDEDQQVIQINTAGSELFNIKALQATGRHCSEFFHCYQQYDHCPVLENSKDINQQEFFSASKNSKNHVFLKSSTKIKIGNKNAVLESFIDITDKIKYQSDLMDAVIESERANKLKSEFLANMSHELRTPLHAILGFSKLGLQKTDPSMEKVNSYFSKIEISGHSLLSLLNDLLDISKLEAGRMKLTLGTTNL